MTTEIGALRRAFEAYINPDADVNLHWLAAGYYAGRVSPRRISSSR